MLANFVWCYSIFTSQKNKSKKFSNYGFNYFWALYQFLFLTRWYPLNIITDIITAEFTNQKKKVEQMIDFFFATTFILFVLSCLSDIFFLPLLPFAFSFYHIILIISLWVLNCMQSGQQKKVLFKSTSYKT